MDKETKITVLGNGTAVPELGTDTASIMVNDDIVVDTGWSIVSNLKSNGVDPLQIKYLLFTHLHHDHYLSLPSLLFYWFMEKKDLSELKIIGPDEDVQAVVDQAMEFLVLGGKYYTDRNAPTVIPLKPGTAFETEAFVVDTYPTVHTAQSMAYRFTNKLTNKTFTYSGDTAFHPPVADFAKGSSLLIHEATLGPKAVDQQNNSGLHSGALDAANIAQMAEVPSLLLVHGELELAEKCVHAAREIFTGHVEWPKMNQVITL